MTVSSARCLAVVAVLVGFLAGCVAPTQAQTTPPPIVWKEGAGSGAAPELVRFNQLLADLADRLRPALVHVRVERAAKDEAGGEREGRRASGSGFVVDERGFIVTNEHVIDGADKIHVRIADGRRVAAKVVGKDRRVDLALLKIEAPGLTAIPIADSNRVRVGEFVLALGHPFNLEHSVSFGIVSRKGAPLTVAAPGFDFIQTDAAINPGNSGGPLVNMAGEVVGVNSMAARNGSIGFAIPANLVKVLVPQLASKGRIDWGWLGIGIAEVTDDDLERLKIKETRGVLVRSIMPGEPADKGGLKVNDVIVGLGETRLDGPRDLQRVVSSTPAGTKVRVKLFRDGQEQEVEVTIGLYKERETAR
ncbi:MAG: trypsin-like peptidase domain-containing protein [Candidatus Rokubacteria bacterium]|nr:trypsin-like peptidase domain-containing protein [Candidatus Rokubacteria bacterium]